MEQEQGIRKLIIEQLDELIATRAQLQTAEATIREQAAQLEQMRAALEARNFHDRECVDRNVYTFDMCRMPRCAVVRAALASPTGSTTGASSENDGQKR
jgi:hypothetical protein